jgi:hypothetical protein
MPSHTASAHHHQAAPTFQPADAERENLLKGCICQNHKGKRAPILNISGRNLVHCHSINKNSEFPGIPDRMSLPDRQEH